MSMSMWNERTVPTVRELAGDTVREVTGESVAGFLDTLKRMGEMREQVESLFEAAADLSIEDPAGMAALEQLRAIVMFYALPPFICPPALPQGSILEDVFRTAREATFALNVLDRRRYQAQEARQRAEAAAQEEKRQAEAQATRDREEGQRIKRLLAAAE